MSKTLTASVKLNTADAEKKLKRLAISINYINKAINGKSNTALEASLDKQLIAAQRVRKATADAEMAELRLATAKEKQAQATQKQIDAEIAAAERQLELERNLFRQKQQDIWKAFQAEQTAYEQSIAQKKQADAEAGRQRLILNSQRVQQERETEERIHRDAMAKMRKQYQAEERESRKLAEQERRLREKQHREELRRIEKEAKARKRANQELSHDILSAVKGAIGAYVGVMGLRVVINTADVITSAENKLNHINDGDTHATQEQMTTMYNASQRSRMRYSDMMSNVGKSMTLAPDAFKGDIDNAIRFQEIMAKTYTLAGASAAEMSSSMYQLIQGLGSGILQGDELRSVREGAPLAYQKIEEFAKGVYGAEENLKDLASQGKITSDMVVAAIMQSGEAVDKAFADTKMTFAQTGVMVKNMATKAFQPALQKLTEALGNLADAGFFEGLSTIFTIIGKLAYWVASGFAWIAENWNWLRIIIVPLITLVGLFTTVMLIFAVAQAIVTLKFKIMGNTALMAWFKALWPIFLVIAAIVLVISILRACGISFAEMAGVAVGALLWVASVIWNTVVGVINAVLQFLWTFFVEPWIGIIEWVLNVFNGGFNSFGDGIKNLLGNIISWFLSLGQVVTKIIDAIFGTNWTGGLESLKGKVLNWGKNENSITLSREAPTLQSMTDGQVDRWASKDAYNTGYDWASNGVNSIGKNLTNWDEKLGMDNMGAFDDIEANTDNTADNTGRMADSMELSEEDLAALVALAEMEWKKEYTTANITVDMSNYNTFNDTSDYEGFALYVRDVIAEEASAVANGAYGF